MAADEAWDARWAGHGRMLRWTLTFAALVLCLVAATVVVAQVDASVEARRSQEIAPHAGAPTSGTGTGARSSRSVPALELVREWDGRRADAWRKGDAEALATLYAGEASAGHSDVENLERWRARGWTVRAVKPQLLGVVEVRRGKKRWVLDVTDRMAGAEGTQGGEVVTLPASAVSTRRLVFLARDGEWVLQEVTLLS